MINEKKKNITINDFYTGKLDMINKVYKWKNR